MKLQVLYEDNHLIAVNKPAGILTQPDKTGDPSLMDEVKYFLKNKYEKPGNVFLGLLHRLDRNVSGIVLFAKTSKGAARLSEQIRKREFIKTYTARVEGVPEPASNTLIDYLLKDEENNFVSIVSEITPGAQRAELSYETLSTDGKFSILRIKLGTGRTHQIRVQLSDIGCPIVGDKKYGSSIELPERAIALTATELTFKTATTDEMQTIKIDFPY
jgi:23S rRNA pseudouridine1911/1915/1917 synthase